MSAFLLHQGYVTVLFAVFIVGAYVLIRNMMINSQHGAICEWTNRLNRLVCRVSCERVRVDENSGIATITAALSENERSDFADFLALHDTVDRASIRLLRIDRVPLFICAALFLAALFALPIAAPVLWGAPPLTAEFPAIIVIVPTVVSTALYLVFSIPHGAEWNRLKNATARSGDS